MRSLRTTVCVRRVVSEHETVVESPWLHTSVCKEEIVNRDTSILSYVACVSQDLSLTGSTGTPVAGATEQGDVSHRHAAQGDGATAGHTMAAEQHGPSRLAGHLLPGQGALCDLDPRGLRTAMSLMRGGGELSPNPSDALCSPYRGRTPRKRVRCASPRATLCRPCAKRLSSDSRQTHQHCPA